MESEATFDDRDVNAVLTGIFDIKANLAQIAVDVSVIRFLLEDGDEEEKEEADGPPA